MIQRGTSGENVVCPDCGATNQPGSQHCGQCGRRLEAARPPSTIWTRGISGGPTPPGSEVIDLYPAPPLTSSQATTPISSDDWATGATRPISTRPPLPPPPPAPPPPLTWQPPESPPPERRSAPRRPEEPGGPPGCVLGCLAFILIGVVAGFFLYTVARPYVNDQVSDRVTSGITSQIGGIGAIEIPASGQITLTDADLNAEIQGYTGSISPIEDPVASIDLDGITLKFKVYGVSSKLHATLRVVQGRIVLENASVSGLAGRLVDAKDLASVVETQLDGLLTRSGVKPVSIVMSQGSLTVVTNPVNSTSV